MIWGKWGDRRTRNSSRGHPTRRGLRLVVRCFLIPPILLSWTRRQHLCCVVGTVPKEKKGR